METPKQTYRLSIVLLAHWLPHVNELESNKECAMEKPASKWILRARQTRSRDSLNHNLMFQNVRVGSSKQGLALGIGIWIFIISSMSIFLLLKLVKGYEIAIVFSLLCLMVKLSVMVKQWNKIWLRFMWYYVSLFIGFVSFGTHGSYGGKSGS